MRPRVDAIWLIKAPGTPVTMQDATVRAYAAASAKDLWAAGLAWIGLRYGSSLTVPGAASGWEAAVRRFGSRSRLALLEPEAELADTGFHVSRYGAAGFLAAEPVLRAKGTCL